MEKLIEYCEYELTCIKRYGVDPNQATTRCFGAVMFFSLEHPDLSEEVGDWWDCKMHPKFRELGGV